MAGPGGVEIDPRFLPTFSAPVEKKPTRGLLAAGVSSGVDDLQGMLGAAAQGAGKLLGVGGLESFGRGISERNMAESAENGRPDLEVAPWREGGADVLPWLGYQAAKQIPTIATYMLGGKAFRAAGGKAPDVAVDFGTMVPRALGGGGVMPGSSFAVRRAAVDGGARQAGQEFAQDLTGGALAGIPIGFGAMMQEADQKEGGATFDDAVTAAALSPVYSALDAVQPAGLKGVFQRGQAGNILRRVATAAFAGAAAEVPQEGIQTALEQSFRPDLSTKEKMTNIVDAAVTGGAVGGAFGGAAGIRRMKRADPTSVPTDDLAAVVDEMLKLPGPGSFAGDVPAPNTVVGVDPAGEATVSTENDSYLKNEPGSVPRPYEGTSAEELQVGLGAARKQVEAGTASEEVKRFVIEAHNELQIRNETATSDMVSTAPVEAVQRGAEPAAGDEGAIPSAPASANQPEWTTERGTLLKGIATRKWYQEAQTPEELDTILRARLENGSTAKSDMELAKRRGIDVNAPAAPVEATPTSTPEQTQQTSLADPAFAERWKSDVQQHGLKDKGARSINPTDEADAQVQLYRALGRDGEIGDGLETLAQRYGILDENKQLTPRAIEIAQKDPITKETADKAARAQGYKGTAVTMFDRGVKAHLGGAQVAKFDSMDDWEAYTAGARWAEEHNSVPKVASSYWTAGVMRAQSGGSNTAPGSEIEVSPEQRDRQSANNVIDAAAPGDDIAQLKRMVRDGDVEGAMQGLLRVQRGESLFQQPEAQPREFVGETVTPGAPKQRVGAVTLEPTKAASRAETERAIRRYEMTRAIDAAFAEGRIDGVQRLRLVGKLRQGRIGEILAEVPTDLSRLSRAPAASMSQRRARQQALVADLQEALIEAEIENEVQALSVDENGLLSSNEVKTTRRAFLTGVAAVAAASVARPARAQLAFRAADDRLRRIMENGNAFMQRAEPVLEHIKAHSKDPVYRMIAAKLLRGEWGKKVMILLRNDSEFVRGTSTVEDDGSISIQIFGEDGLNEQTILHELIHAYVQLRWAGLGVYLDGNKRLLKDTKDRGDATIKRFQDLWRKIGDSLLVSNRGLIDNNVWAEQVVTDPDEMLSWVLTNPDAQAYFKSVDIEGNEIKPEKKDSEKTIWGRIVDFFASLFGGGEPVRSALDDILAAGYAVIDAGVTVSTDDFAPKIARAIAEQRNSMPMLKTPQSFNLRAQDVIGAVTGAVKPESAAVATRRMTFGWNTIGHLVAHYARQFPQLMLYAKAHLERRATQARWSQLFEVPYQAYEHLERTEPKVAETVRYLMGLTQFEIDPTKPWDKHEHLHNAPNAARLQELTEGANRKYNTLRGKGHARIYDDFRGINEATHLAMMSVSLYNLVASDPVLKRGIEGFEIDPTDAFRERPALHESPRNAQRYWSDMLDAQVKRADEYIVQLRGETVGSASEQQLQSMRLEPIEMRIKSIRESLNAMRNAPYFHLGRHGEHFVSFTLRVGDDKRVDPSAIDHAGKVIEAAGFRNVEISRDSLKPNVYIRVDTIEARHQLEKVVKQLEKGGWLKPDSEIKAAPRSTTGDIGTADKAPAWLERYIELLQASPMFEPTDNMTDAEKTQLSAKKAQMVSHARELWLDMLPDTALSKVMVHRNAVPGFDRDMIRNFAFRFQVGVNALANLSASAKLTDAFTQMRAAVFDAQVVGSAQHGEVDLLQSLLSEVLVREAQRPLREGSNWIDTFRALNHAFFLGFSPSYVLVNTTQLGVLLWPELAKKHSFAKSAKAIAGVTGTALKIMTETLKAGAAVGPKRALDAVITEDVLKKAGVDEGTASFLMKIISEGIIDIGGSSRELGRVADGSINESVDTGLRWAASFGLYSETFTRLVAALSARKLAGDDIPYARQVIDQSMLNYADWNTARQMGKLGFAGPMTKVMTAFMQYSAQVLEKLYREFHTVITARQPGESAEAHKQRQVEARRFLAGHVTAVTLLAGTLGMPFATVGATAIEKLVDLLDDDEEPYDATAAWRNYLSGIFGKELGEVIARGAPRAAGFDLSQRAGEQNLIPFSQFLTDKRKWREASSEAALRSLGAPVSMLMSIAEGGEKIGNGDVLGGMTSMLPMALKGPAKSYQMSEDGYKDTLGNKLPMTPNATAIMMQLFGLTPQERAEYSEARGDQAARKGQMIQRAKVLREQLITALTEGDDDALGDLIAAAQEFDAANPAYAVIPDIRTSMRRRAKMQGIAAATGTPIGVNPKDIAGQELTGYANIEFSPR